MDFGLLPPEINSGRMYTGPGAAPMLGAATAWGALAVELRSTAVAYSSVISELTAQWRGPSSAKMVRAAASYSAWVDVTAANAEHTAEQATAAAGAFDTAYPATVPPPIVAANRAQLAFLVATNVLGQNAPAIAATEIQYAEMWAQDATAMHNYAACSAAASQVTAFASPPRGTTAPAASAADPPTDPISAIGTILGPTSPLSLLSPGIGGYLIGTEPYGLASVGSSVANLHQKVLALPSTPGGVVLQGDVGSNARLVGSPARVSAELGRAGAVARLSVPPSWPAAAPEMRLSAAAGSAIGLVNPPTAIATDIPGNFYGNLALQGAATRAAADPDGVGRSARGRVQPWQNTTTIIVVPDDE